jgi:1-acyl-sn-glycerol-3-phosphate acyltransferase
MLSAIRSFLFLLFMAVTVVPWATVVVILSIFISPTAMYWACAGWLKLSIWGAKVICGVRYRVSGSEHLPTAADSKSAVVLLSKHLSTWETFAYPALMSHPLCYVFKRELLYIPFFGWAMARMDMIHIDRSKRSQAWSKVAEQGKRLMGQGNWVIMFPEGTRAPRGGKGEYKNGGSRLAIAAGVPVVPIAVSSAKCWPRKSFLLKPGLIDVSIGPAIPSVGRHPDELMREVEQWIETEMRHIDPEAYLSTPRPGDASAARGV